MKSPEEIEEYRLLNLARTKLWKANNKELVKLQKKRWLKTKAGRKWKSSSYKKWKVRSKPLVRAHKLKRRATMTESDVDGSGLWMGKILTEQRIRLEECIGVKFHVDHIKSLARGGSHHANNLRLLPATLNMKKNCKENYPLPTCWA